MSESITIKIVAATIDRGREVIHVHVPEHEVHILRAVHGIKEVAVVDPHFEDEDVSASAEGEFLRLTRKYHRLNAPNPVLLAYPQGARDLVREGFSLDVGAKAETASGGVKLRQPNKKQTPGTARAKAA